MKVIGYIRVSTEEQASGGLSLGAQRDKLEQYCKLYDLELAAVIEDAGVSAKTLDRAGLREALRLLKSKQAAGLVVAKLDRLSRSVGDWNELIDGYFGERAGKQLFSVADAIDTRSASGRMVLNILMSVAQWEREAIGERTKDALTHKRKRGERTGKGPFGFDLATDGVSLVENPAEQEALQIIRELRAAGESLRSIASKLTARGIPTKEGGAWCQQSIGRIVKRAA